MSTKLWLVKVGNSWVSQYFESLHEVITSTDFAEAKVFESFQKANECAVLVQGEEMMYCLIP